MFFDILPEVVIAVLHVVEMFGVAVEYVTKFFDRTQYYLLKSTIMKISFTSFDSTLGLGQPGDQGGSRRQKIILPLTL